MKARQSRQRRVAQAGHPFLVGIKRCSCGLRFWPTAFLILLFISSSTSQTPRPARIAVLDFRHDALGNLVADKLAKALSADSYLQIIDRDQSRSASLGAGYTGSLNMTVSEARDLASAIGCDALITGEAQTLLRSPSGEPPYYESSAAMFIVSGQTGRLIFWENPSCRAAEPHQAEEALAAAMIELERCHRYGVAIRRALEDERAERTRAVESNLLVIEVMSDNDSSANNSAQAPRPFRRLKPPYPDDAARAEVEATVDVLVDIDAKGEVGRVEVARWAGYGLDQSVVDTVKQLHFFPAQRDGAAIPMRVLLRYNFRKPSIQSRSQ